MVVTERFTILQATIRILFLTKFVHGLSGETRNTFPDNFLFGASTSSYQIEGGWNASDKGPNIWDRFTHDTPWKIKDHSNGDEACDSYRFYKEDVKLLNDIGVNFYRFSLSWSRILPKGVANLVSKDGLDYYKTLIDELLAKGIQPFVTIYHWDLPYQLEETGGWTNELIVDYFVDYARIVFRELGPKVKYFVTINEPTMFCTEGYGLPNKAPGKNLTGYGEYLCLHNVLKAHAKVYHMYDKEFRPTQNGLISITAPCTTYIAKNTKEIEAEDVGFQFNCGWLTHPIFSKTGDYPKIMKDRIAENSRIQGYPRSRLPEFTPEWIEYIRGTADFFALNHYTSKLVESVPKKPNTVWYQETGLNISIDPNWPSGASSWMKVVPVGFRKILNKIKDEYDNPAIFVTENGYSDRGALIDLPRIRYHCDYLKAMLSALYEDGCNIKAYSVWSLLDNFEWEAGYTESFGLVRVDFGSPNKERFPKMSMKWYTYVVKNRRIIEYDQFTEYYNTVRV